MLIKENEPLKSKTTMRIGGTARYFMELTTKEDVESAVKFSQEKKLPLILLGSGSNTIFADGTIDAVVARINQSLVKIEGELVTVYTGKNLAMLINELADVGLDLSALTGIPGTIGGAVFGNAGQGPKGLWIDSFIHSVTVYTDGKWKNLTQEECMFRYRESIFKDWSIKKPYPCIIWEIVLKIPASTPEIIKKNMRDLLQKRIETQPHRKTAGSCFKAVGDVPAWQLIDAAGLRGYNVGGCEISEKHANFLLNTGDASFSDAAQVVKKVRQDIPKNLEVEMRFIQKDGNDLFASQGHSI